MQWFLAHGGDMAIHLFGVPIPEFAMIGLPALIGGIVTVISLRKNKL